MSPKLSRARGGRLELSLTAEERDLLRSLPDQLRTLYEAGPDDSDPVRGRLFPRAYLDPTAENAEREWRDLVHPELVRDRLASLDQLLTALDAERDARRGGVVIPLDDESSGALLSVLNDARLALGTQLGVTEDLDYDSVTPDDPRAPGLGVYGWLTYVQGEIIEALLAGLPD
ncbi:MAG: DUF2017 family protein [Acidimicrobiia bacterium]|nr:DUF2017 family protein [Acidimicrobiia bacterium]